MRLTDIVPAPGFSRRMRRCILWAENPVAPFLLLVFTFAAQAKPIETCSLSGTVVDSVTNKPLNKVDIRLQPLDGRGHHTAISQSDSEGRFALEKIDPGSYRLEGLRSGYLQTGYGARRDNRNGAVLRLEAGQVLKDVEIKLVPSASISGTVRDLDGDPVGFAQVVTGRRSYVLDGPGDGDLFQLVGSTSTDDLGQYRIPYLRPGKYYVGAAPIDLSPRCVRDHSPPSAGPREVSLRTYYPGVQDPAHATPIEVAVGSHVTGINVTLARAATVRVRGRATKAAGIEAKGLSIALSDRSRFSLLGFSVLGNTISAAGDFEFESVPPGSYMIIADIGGAYETSATIEVGRADVEGVSLVVGPGADVKGRVTVEGAAKLDTKIRVRAGTRTSGGHYGEAAGDGTFALQNLPPGRYAVTVHTAPAEQVYVKAMRSDQTDVLKDGLTISRPGVAALEITVSTDGGMVQGSVLDKEERPAVGATVVLVPEARFRSRGDLFKTSSTDQDGRYEWKAIPPGDYKLFAWDDVEPGAWHDPDFLKEYEPKATPITIHPNGREVVRVHVLAEGAQ